jgi:hypothetical protein
MLNHILHRKEAMDTMSQCCVATVLSSGLAFVMIGSADPARAGNATLKVYIETIGNGGHDRWQWAVNFSTADNPREQDWDVDCSAAQSGKIWFPAGAFGSSAECTRSIKQGRAIFFPLFHRIFCTALQPVPEDYTDESDCRADAGASIDTITNWMCTVDDTPCVWSYQDVRAQSDVQPLNSLAGSILTDFGYAPGIREIAIANGYWIRLDPLPPGLHTIHFTLNAPGFSLDAIYHLRVTPDLDWPDALPGNDNLHQEPARDGSHDNGFPPVCGGQGR